MKTDHETIQRDLTGTRNLAIQMMQNALYIQKQLPSLEMPDDLRTRISKLCDELIGTKHDLINEVFEVSEWLESEPHRYEPWKERIRSWVDDTIRSIDECVVALQEGVQNGLVSHGVLLLVMESAVNIMNTVPSFTTVPKNEESDSDYNQDEHEEDEEEGGYDPNCYAFYTEDSYPVGTLITAIRKLMDRPDLPYETAGNLKIFLFAMERLPLVTPGVRMSLGLRLDQGGESAWMEIRMEDGEFSLGRGTWIDGDADTEAVFEVTPDCREGDAFVASQFAESFKECARDVCRKVVIEDASDKPFTEWDLQTDKSRWSDLPCSFL